ALDLAELAASLPKLVLRLLQGLALELWHGAGRSPRSHQEAREAPRAVRGIDGAVGAGRNLRDGPDLEIARVTAEPRVRRVLPAGEGAVAQASGPRHRWVDVDDVQVLVGDQKAARSERVQDRGGGIGTGSAVVVGHRDVCARLDGHCGRISQRSID